MSIACTLDLNTSAFESIDLDSLYAVTGGDGADTAGAVGNFIGRYAGAAGGAVGGAIGGAALGGPTVAGVPVLATAGGGLGGAAGYDLGGRAGEAIGRGAYNAGAWVGNQASKAWNWARGR